MIPIRHLLTRVPINTGQFMDHGDDAQVWIDPEMIDTITEITEARRRSQPIPGAANCVIRYRDNYNPSGYRLMYAANLASHLARMMHRHRVGEDPTGPDYEMSGV